VPFEYIDRVLDVISETPQHTYQLLTKRADRMHEYFESMALDYCPPKNMWLGVTCESSKYFNRIEWLKMIELPNVKFLSCEPLLGDLSDINLDGIDWVITGGESGVCARRTSVEWFRNLRDRCVETDTSFFFKQWGTWGEDGIKRGKKDNGCMLDGREWKQYPKV
jgi:protein gp37